CRDRSSPLLPRVVSPRSVLEVSREYDGPADRYPRVTSSALPTPARPSAVTEQVARLAAGGVHDLAGTSPGGLGRLGAGLPDAPGAVAVVHPGLVPAAAVAPVMRREGRRGFAVVDMTDLADFAPTDDVEVPDSPLYVVTGVTRDDDRL